MPDVEITNPIVQIDLAGSTSTSVPAGERWKVSLMTSPSTTSVELNGTRITRGNDATTTSHVRTDLYAGDTVKAVGGPVRVRGYQVEA